MTDARGDVRIGGRYAIRESLAFSGLRRVWQCVDELLGKVVVVKGVFVPEGDSGGAAVAEEFKRLRRFRHPRIARAFDLGRVQGIEGEPSQGSFHFFTQEWVSGPSLLESRGQLSLPRVRQCIREVLEVVAFLHHCGLTRLDVKSEHLVQGETGWRLIDLDQASPDDPLRDGVLFGTLPYLAPEIFHGDSGGPRADLYSVGVVLFEALIGSCPPMRGQTLQALASWLPTSPVPDFPKHLRKDAGDLVMLGRRLLARDPADRPSSAQEALSTLDGAPARWQSSCPLPEGSLVGRTGVLHAIRRLERQANEASGGGLTVNGPARSGRTRLLLELAGDWQSEGRPALVLSPGTISAVHRTGVELVTAHLESLLARDGPKSEASCEAEPLQESGADTVQVDRPMGEAREDIICRNVSQLRALGVAAASRRGRPIPIVFDDFCSLDELTRATITRFVPALPGSGLLFVLSGTSVSQDDGCGLPVVELPPLELDSLQALGEDILGPSGIRTTEEARYLLDMSEGRFGPIRAALFLRWQKPKVSLFDWTPEGGETLAHQLLEGLPGGVATAARAAAIFDRPFSHPLLAALVSGSERRRSVLAALVESCILVRQAVPVGGPVFHFAEEGARRVLEGAIPEPERRQYHQRAAETLECASFRSLEVSPGRVAHHFIVAGLPRRARPHLLRALEGATRAGRLEEASGYLRHLLETAEPSDPDLGEFTLRLGEVAFELGKYEEARKIFEEISGASCASDTEHAGRRAVGLSRTLAFLGKVHEARDVLEDALSGSAISGSRIAPRERVELNHLLAWVHLETRALGEAQISLREASRADISPTSRQAVDHAYLEALQELLSNAESGLASEAPNKGGRSARESILSRLENAAEIAREIGYRRGEMKIVSMMVRVHESAGDLARARARSEKNIELARRVFDLRHEAGETHNLGILLRRMNAPHGAITQFERAARLYQCLGNRDRETENRLEAAELLLAHGKPDRAKTALDLAARYLETVENPPRQTTVLHHRLLETRLDLRRGKLQGLAERLRTIDEDLEAVEAHSMVLEVVADRMELALLQKQPDTVHRLYARVTERVPRAEEREIWVRVHRAAMEAHRLMLPQSAEEGAPAESSQPSAETAKKVETSLLGSELVWLERLERMLRIVDDPEALARTLGDLTGELLGGRPLVCLFEPSSPQFSWVHPTLEGQVDDISHTIIEWVRQHRKPRICPDIRVNTVIGRIPSLRAAKVGSLACFPVLRDDVCIGVIYIDHRERGRVTREKALAIVEKMAALTPELLSVIARRQKQKRVSSSEFGLDGTSPAISRVRERIRVIAEVSSDDLVVLLRGQTGTGKEVVARAIHRHCRPHGSPFVSVNCAGIPAHLFESEMHGAGKGAFTGAHVSRAGWYEMANGGTMFLDEIGLMPLEQQAKLLKVVQDRTCARVGTTKDIPLEFHLICATNEDLWTMAEEKRFREDLFERINVNLIWVPTLRERGRDDINLLARRFISVYLQGRNLLNPSDDGNDSLRPLEDFLTPEATDFLYEYSWPRNVRQLENLFRDARVRRRLLTFNSKSRETVTLSIVREVLEPGSGVPSAPTETQFPLHITHDDLDTALRRLKAAHVERKWKSCGRNASQTARQLSCSRQVVYKYLEIARRPEKAPDNDH